MGTGRITDALRTGSTPSLEFIQRLAVTLYKIYSIHLNGSQEAHAGLLSRPLSFSESVTHISKALLQREHMVQPYNKTIPPSTIKLCPCTQLALVLQSHTQASAISSAIPSLFKGVESTTTCIASIPPILLVIGVSISPGQIQLTLILCSE